MLGLLIPLFSTSALIAFIYLRSRAITEWYCAAHWRLALSNSRWLLGAYAVSAVLMLLAWLVSQAAHEPSMKHILWTALTRIALLPTLVGVMITAILEAGAISLASKRELTDQLLAAFPPPKR